MPVEWLHSFALSRWAIYTVIGHISTTKAPILKRMTALDSALQVGLSTFSEVVLIVVGVLVTAGVKKRGNKSHRHLYIHHQGLCTETDSAIGFRMSNMPIHIIGSRHPGGWSICGRELSKSKIAADFRNIAAARSAIAKRMTPLDSAHQICLFTLPDDVLVVVWGPYGSAL